MRNKALIGCMSQRAGIEKCRIPRQLTLDQCGTDVIQINNIIHVIIMRIINDSCLKRIYHQLNTTTINIIFIITIILQTLKKVLSISLGQADLLDGKGTFKAHLQNRQGYRQVIFQLTQKGVLGMMTVTAKRTSKQHQAY